MLVRDNVYIYLICTKIKGFICPLFRLDTEVSSVNQRMAVSRTAAGDVRIVANDGGNDLVKFTIGKVLLNKLKDLSK